MIWAPCFWMLFQNDVDDVRHVGDVDHVVLIDIGPLCAWVGFV